MLSILICPFSPQIFVIRASHTALSSSNTASINALCRLSTSGLCWWGWPLNCARFLLLFAPAVGHGQYKRDVTTAVRQLDLVKAHLIAKSPVPENSRPFCPAVSLSLTGLAQWRDVINLDQNNLPVGSLPLRDDLSRPACAGLSRASCAAIA